MRVFVFAGVFGVVAVAPSSRAYADPPAPAASPDLDATAHGDAAASRGFVFGTGLVLGAGQVDASLRTVVQRGSELSLGVGLGGGIELTIDGFDSDNNKEQVWMDGIELRMRVAQGRRYTVSIAASYHYTWNASYDFTSSEGNESRSAYGVGADAAFAVTRRLAVAAGLSLQSFPGDGPFVDTHLDATFAVWSHLKVLAEVGNLGNLPLGVFGVRFASRYGSVDAGLGVTNQSTDLGYALAGPVAVVAVSARL